MTIEEKRALIHEVCDSHPNCDECPLRYTDGWDEMEEGADCLTILFATEKDLDRAMRICGIGTNDTVNHPSHYNDGKIEVIDYIEDKKLGFCLGNAVKYISRAGKKDKSKEVEDLRKAIWYIERRISQIETQ